ncbi:MAG: nitroreductase family protein [Deltaproteobacteria bacterium]|nr:nitroreductase family protein [Deltaproteobacteria bacterium]NNK84359.1 nitroreductase family protein [Desulfobacterales bacterium]
MIEELIKQNRSCRRYYEDYEINKVTLKDLVNLARLSASAANLQPLKYILSCSAETNEHIFSCLAWAAYLNDWSGPEAGERPSAYIIILGDTNITKDFGCDHGIASQSILLAAREKGLAGCMIGMIKRTKLRNILNIQEHFEILLVLAIGKPKEKITIETVGDDDNIKYWRDNDSVHHVPKRKLEDIIISGH